MLKSSIRFSAMLLLLVGYCCSLLAQDAPWPAKPIRLIVPGGSGGVLDIRARWLADRLAPALGQPIVVDIRAGAGGLMGTEMAAHSQPDGYTLVMVHQGSMAINPHLYSRLGYEPLTDFIPITRIGFGPLLLAVYPGLAVHSVADLIQLAKEKPGQLNFGSPGIGTPPHLAGELFKRIARIDVNHVPYKSGGQAVTDLIGGHLAFSIEGLTVQLPQVKAGRLRALAVTSLRRIPTLPEIPTVAESGAPGYEFVGWVGLAAPAATPKLIIDRLYREVAKILDSAEGRDYFASYGAEPGGEPPEVFAGLIRSEYSKWGKVVREAGIKLE